MGSLNDGIPDENEKMRRDSLERGGFRGLQFIHYIY